MCDDYVQTSAECWEGPHRMSQREECSAAGRGRAAFVGFTCSRILAACSADPLLPRLMLCPLY